MSEALQLDYYFDYSCPWSYIGFVRLLDIATRNRAEIDYRPVSIGRILATENPALAATRFAENPAKAAWQLKDLGQWARFWGLPMELPDNWPYEAPAALQGGIVAAEAGFAVAYNKLVFRAVFGEGRDIADAKVITELAIEAGADSALFEEQLNAPKTVAAVDKNTDDLLQHGGFGTPTVVLDGELLFGNDRMPLVEWLLSPVTQEGFVMPGQHDQY